MANTLSVMTNVLRNVVSKQRIRYKEGGYNLDLAYICDNIIAMGYPADKIESIYRNRLEDVYKFLEDYHRDHYKIYNLCLERSYDINKFHKRVGVFPFEDHNPPSIELIQTFCRDVDQWLKEDSNNVAAVHCKAGKGRTGTMICCYLLYSGQQSSAEGALTFYDEKRTKDRKGVTIPSQRRYVQYFSTLVRSGVSYVPRTLKLCEIRFGEASHLQSQGVVNCTISRFQDNSSIITTLCNICIDFRKTTSLDLTDLDLLVAGDIKVEISHKTSRKSYFHFWINTYFVCSTDDTDSQLVYTLNKGEIDDIHKDKEHKLFSEDFKVQLVFFNVTETPKESNFAESCQLVEKEVELFQNEGCADAATNGKSLLHDILDCENLRNTSFSATNNIFYKKSEQASNTISESFQPSTLNDATTVYETHKEERHTKNVILKKPKIHRNTASHHINELSEKIGKTSICDENNDLRISNSHIHQLQIIRNKCNISSVCSNNTLSIGDDNIEQDRECGESADNQLQQNVLLPSVAPSSSVNSSSLDFFFENDNTSNLSRTLTNTENGFSGCSKNRIEELTKREEKSDIKTKFSNLHLCNVECEMATNKLQTFKHDLLEPTTISKNRIGFFFIKRISNKVQNKYFKHKNFVSYANANMFQSRPSTIASGSKCSRVKSSKHTYKIKLKLKNQRSKAISDVKIKQSSHILKLNDSDYFTFLNNDMLLKSCPSKHISFKEMYGTPSCTHPVRHSEEFKTISNVGSLPCSEDFYSSICDKQLISKSSLCESAQRLQCMSLNFSSCDNVENINANVSCKLLKPVSMPEHVDSHERESEHEHSIIKKISNEENVTKTP